MKNILILAISLFVFASCGSDTSKKDDGNVSTEKTTTKISDANGEHVISTYTNGTPKIVRTYKTEGEQRVAVYEKENYEDGKLLKEGGLKNGKRHGLWKSYRRDGILWSEGDYNEGVRNGITITYHPNGKKYYEGTYTDGKKSGKWTFYNNEGQVVKEENFSK